MEDCHTPQSKWVVEEIFPGLVNGFFIELGAADGEDCSDTYALEKIGWNGLCIEANSHLFAKLSASRNCMCVNTCIDTKKREVRFVENGHASGILADDTNNSKQWAKAFKNLKALKEHGKIKNVIAKPLIDVLRECKAPSEIHYLSLDVEGAETRILRDFPFQEFKFLSMTIEEPTPALNKILFKNHYVFVKNRIVYGRREDGFYIHESIDRSDIKKEPFEQIVPKKPYIARHSVIKSLKKHAKK